MNKTILLLLTFLLPCAVQAQGRVTRGQGATPSQQQPRVMRPDSASYRVRIDPSSDQFVVRAEFLFGLPRDTVYLSLPSWTTGHYEIANYAR
jgi:hypothetical protein